MPKRKSPTSRVASSRMRDHPQPKERNTRTSSSRLARDNRAASHPSETGNAITIPLDTIYHMDCLAGMSQMPEKCVDLVITDPPFAIDFKAKRSNYNRTQARFLDGYVEIPKNEYLDFTLKWMGGVHRVLKDSGSMYVFSGWNHLKDILTGLEMVGFTTVNHIIWKYQFGVVTTRKFVTSHYHCLYVCKNERLRKFFPYARFPKSLSNSVGRSLHYEDKEDVWYIKREYWHGDEKTPTKLPAELIKKILLYSSEPGDVVLDPFLGSGQVAVVSKMLNRRFIGFEIVREYYEFARRRLERDNYRIKASRSNTMTLDLFEPDS